jgi:hypothetical protein
MDGAQIGDLKDPVRYHNRAGYRLAHFANEGGICTSAGSEGVVINRNNFQRNGGLRLWNTSGDFLGAHCSWLGDASGAGPPDGRGNSHGVRDTGRCAADASTPLSSPIP